MDRIEIGRYSNADPWLGWVASAQWILFTHKDGSLTVFNGRDEKGAVTGQGVKVEAPKDGRSGENQSPPPPPELPE